MGAKRKRLRLLLVPALLLLAECTTIAPFNQRAYEQATSVKAQALLVIDEATEPFAEHKAEVRELRFAVEKAYEFAKGRPKNEFATRQWEVIRDPKRNSLAGFLKRWEEKGVLKEAFVSDQKDEIAKHFDEVHRSRGREGDAELGGSSPMAMLDDLLSNLDQEVRALIDREWKDLRAAASKDAAAFLELLKPDLQKWAGQLKAGELEMDDVEYMLGSRRDRAELQELKRLGLAQAKRDKLVNGVVELVTKAMSKLA